MTVPGNSFLVVIITLSILVSSAYAVGRIHEWHRHGLKRDEAYRLGYDKASVSMIGMMNTDIPPAPPHTTTRSGRPDTRRIERHVGNVVPTHHRQSHQPQRH
jgi:gentisate 1,2-dioxygenase